MTAYNARVAMRSGPRSLLLLSSLLAGPARTTFGQEVDINSVCDPVRAAQPRGRFSDAEGQPQLPSGDGVIRFQALKRPHGVAVWAQEAPDVSIRRFPDYALYIGAQGHAIVREGDGTEVDVGAYKVGDVFEISIHGGVVEYVGRGEVLHVSGRRVTYPLVASGCSVDPAPAYDAQEPRRAGWSLSRQWTEADGLRPLDDPSFPGNQSAVARATASKDASERAAEIFGIGERAQTDILGDADRQTLAGALGDADTEVQAAAVWALQIAADRGDAEAANAVAVDTPARVVSHRGTRYPPSAFVKKIEGMVGLGLLVDREGKVVRAWLRRSMPDLDEAALSGTKEWVFVPARRKGKPFPSIEWDNARFFIF